MSIIISPKRYSAIMYASKVINPYSVIVITDDGMNEVTNYDHLYRDALRVQRRFEIEKAYKSLGVRNLYNFYFNGDANYEKFIAQLQLLLALKGPTALYYCEDNLSAIYKSLRNASSKYVYSPYSIIDGKVADVMILNKEELERKKQALSKFTILREYLLNNITEREYIYRVE